LFAQKLERNSDLAVCCGVRGFKTLRDGPHVGLRSSQRNSGTQPP
jgi:hypothetical protein